MHMVSCVTSMHWSYHIRIQQAVAGLIRGRSMMQSRTAAPTCLGLID